MKKNSALAWTLAGLISIAIIINMVVLLINRDPQSNLITLLDDLLFMAVPVVYGLLAALIISNQPGNVVGWLLFMPALSMALPVDGYIKTFTSAPVEPPWLLLLALWYSSWSWLLLIFPIFFIPVLFPTGRPPSPRWCWLIYGGLSMCAVLLFFATFKVTFNTDNQGMNWAAPNPIGFLPDPGNYFLLPWVAGLFLLTMFSAASVYVRYRSASPVERAQIKWLLYACSLFAVIYIPLAGIELVNNQIISHDIIQILLTTALLSFPVSIAIAILRYRLWDIDVIIRRTLVYVLLSLILGVIFFGGVILLQQLLGRITGVESSPAAIVISTLSIAALFNPLRIWIQNGIDRRFYRRKYNADEAIERFSVISRNEVELEEITAHLLEVVNQSIQPQQTSLWLQPVKKLAKSRTAH